MLGLIATQAGAVYLRLPLAMPLAGHANSMGGAIWASCTNHPGERHSSSR